MRNRNQAWHVYHHPTWHYADFYWDVENRQPRDIPGTGPDSLNAVERIVALRATLVDSSAADTTRAVALAWLLHLVGDVHQPLHCSSRVTSEDPFPRGDRGGNTFALDAGHNLHAYWDEILDRAVAPDPGEDSIAYATRMARRIERIYPPASLATPAASADLAVIKARQKAAWSSGNYAVVGTTYFLSVRGVGGTSGFVLLSWQQPNGLGNDLLPDLFIWTNADDNDHTVTSDDKDVFASDNLGNGDKFRFKFEKAGKFPYHCKYHPRMKGVIIVSD